ncbi:hypothetical protein C8A01DRAFT_15754 [Parachaetomium inaequale]|uniref:Uncharacterized protein n=1 Tax=Parachaetomium inaequale TaxID=2588326 RepID=A0AAN6SRY7_9PEZI|nr:hypothetical protein C8A01DRAFT_15754 [Parachaetomium inaequale]
MARIKQTAKRFRKVTTWTRFHLPREQEWPTFPVADPAHVHLGPLADMEAEAGFSVSLGRMVDDPEQAAYIIQWWQLSDLQKFQASPACAEFLRNLPENDNLQASAESTSSGLRSLTIEDAPSSSSSSPPAPSRFLTLEEFTRIPSAEVQGRVTLNAFLVPRKGDGPTRRAWYESVRAVFGGGFQPRGSEFIRGHGLWWERYMTTWFSALEEDGWVDRKFGKLEEQTAQDPEDDRGRTVIYEFHLWPRSCGATPEHEEASAADPQARESWKEAVAKVMPPVTAWVQERWDIRKVPYFEDDEDEEELEQELDED